MPKSKQTLTTIKTQATQKQNKKEENVIIDKQQILNDFLIDISHKKKGKIFAPEFVYIGNNRYSYDDLVENIDIGNISLIKFDHNIIFSGKSWYIKNWQLFSGKYKINIKDDYEYGYIFEKDDIEVLFDKHKIPNNIIFCINCEKLITLYELNNIHSCKKCELHNLNNSKCKLADKEKKKKTGFCMAYQYDEDEIYCEDCLKDKEYTDKHPGSAWGLEDRSYNAKSSISTRYSFGKSIK